jgi:hypothetical protein
MAVEGISEDKVYACDAGNKGDGKENMRDDFYN